MKEEHTASRTLVKSAPELWAECSAAGSLTRHLGQFGEIKITRLEPETAVAWEGERASGTVRLEPSGWGTQVTLTARATEAEAVSALEPAVAEGLEKERQHEEAVKEADEDTVDEVELEAAELEAVEPELEPNPEPRAVQAKPLAVQAQPKGMFSRLRGLFKTRRAPATDLKSPPAPQPLRTEVRPETDARPEPVVGPQTASAPAPADPETVLIAALDSLGQAHHRPFSRA